MRMQRFLMCAFLGVALTAEVPLAAQNSVMEQYRKQKQQQYDEYRNKKQKQYNDYMAEKRRQFDEYRMRKNKAFAEYLQQKWEQMPLHEATPSPLPEPKPIVQPKAPEKDPVAPELEVKPKEVVTPELPEPVKPIEVPLPEEPEVVPRQSISLFGTSCQVAMDGKLRLSMKSTDEREVTRLWKRLSEDDFTPLFDDFARLNMEMNLNGWATFQLAKAISEQLQGKETNEAAMVCTYLMTQLGYDMRLVRVGNRLVTASPANVDVCRFVSINIEGKDYYLWANVPEGCAVTCYRQNVAEATRPLDFTDAQAMKLQGSRTETKRFTSLVVSKASADVSVSKSLINYYNTLPPLFDWAVYAAQPMDRTLSQQLKPSLQTAIQGKGQWEATRILLQFVQTAFKYGYDEEQFGRERSLFKEETFYYPKSDCEDRSILFSDLVHTLLGLDVVLLHYPNHLCTAVRFTQPGRGDHLTIDGYTYYICDPTYTGADCGTCMPEYVNVQPKVHKIIYE